MELYYASGQVVEYPEVRLGKYTKDFSWGFYCTNNFESMCNAFTLFVDV